MEPTEEQYLILNALETLDLLKDYRYDEDSGVFYIITPSLVLPLAMLRPNGDRTPNTDVDVCFSGCIAVAQLRL